MCLRWPNATFYEHVKYKAGLWNDDPARNDYLKPHHGARENDGFFAAVRFSSAAGITVRWLRDAGRAFSYAAERSNRLVATYTFSDGLVIVEETFNVPDQPFLVRSYRVAAAPGGYADFHIIAFANPALRKEHGEYAPNGDYDNDEAPRYGSFALPHERAVLTALPSAPGAAAELGLLEGTTDATRVASFVASRQAAWGTGIYLAQGASTELAGYQVGTDASIAPEGPADAFADAQDGALSGSLAVAGHETTALLFPISSSGEAAWYAAFGTTAADALAALDAARAQSPEIHAQASDAWWAARLAGAVLPAEPKARAFSLRALISLRTGMDPESGAIVASTSCQPPYNVDWPRDGAFFQFVLDLNGMTEEADRHARFYPNIQYTRPGEGLLARDKVGRFPMNAFADFVPGGPIDWEIDNTGFALWLYRVHAGFLSRESPAAARRFLEDVAPSMHLAADLLAACEDPLNRLQCAANEDDNPEFTQSLHGAITTWLGLRAAADMAAALDDDGRAARYRARAAELDAAIRAHFDPARGAKVHAQQLAWSYWPAGFWTGADAATNAFAADGMLNAFGAGAESLFDERSRGSQYSQKSAIALQLPPLRSAATLAGVDRVHDFYLEKMARAGTLHLGEFTHFNDLDGDGVKEFVNVVATPHIWAQVLVYLSLIARENPASLAVPPIIHVPQERAPAGCGCAAGNAGAAESAVLLVTLIALLRIVRRRGRPRSNRTS